MAVIRQNQADDDANPEKIGTRFTVSKPHPEFGVNPNIKNEYGHTKYPKWVDHPTEKDVTTVTQSVGKDQFITHVIKNEHPKRVLVQNEEEEKALLSGEEKPKSKGWGNKN